MIVFIIVENYKVISSSKENAYYILKLVKDYKNKFEIYLIFLSHNNPENRNFNC